MRISDWSSDVCSSDLDRVGYDQVVFEAIAADYRQLAAQLGISHVACIPVSALQGDNLLRESPQMPWYRGASLLRHLEDIVVRQAPAEAGFRLPVQWVNSRSHDFRGFTGTVAAGVVDRKSTTYELQSLMRIA